MGLSSKQVSGDQDQGLDWGQTLLQSGAAELSKPPPIRRLHQQSEPLNCPRCGSTNTKFCYYNNYNKSQPRHFCKSCKRHWTKGGTLRNVPIGGGRKNKRPKISKPTPSTTTAAAVPNMSGNNSGTTQKSMSNILVQTLMGSPLLHETTKGFDITTLPNTMNFTGLNTSESENINTEFQLSSLATFGSMNPSCYQSLNAFDCMEESTITSVNIPSTNPWPGPEISTSNYWNWNEIDVLASSADLNISWEDDEGDDDAEFKP